MAEEKTPLTKVIFRRWRGEDKSVVALFPEDPGTKDPTTCGSYAHVGQHGSASVWVMMNRTRPVKDPAEYAELKAELEGLGYRLKVCRRSGYRDREAREREIARINGRG